jgi:hypothetical protein
LRIIPFEPAGGDSATIEAIGRHIEKHIAPVETVFHEIVSDLVHVDIHFIPPDDDRPFITLVTSGMSERPMSVPPGLEEFQYAELVALLPPDWPLSQEEFQDEANYWPVRWLKILARLPHEYDTWLSYGHTVPNGDPPEPFAEDTQLCCMMLAPPLLFGEKFHELKVNDEKTIRFWSVIPLYLEEMELKMKKGSEAVFERFDKFNIDEVIDPVRKNVAKKKFGFF